MRQLVKFQSENKYLLTAYSQKELSILGRLAANQEGRPIAEIMKTYETHLHSAFKRSPGPGSNVSVMMKIMGYFSPQLSTKEKSFFLGSLEKYKIGSLPPSACINILKAWIVRFQQEYLTSQTFLEPYPEELATLDTTSKVEERDYWK